jgi:asparagine synthase (glutamine-hydrolysing)
MCGIAGSVKFDGKLVDVLLFYEALTLMKHRGPDDEGIVLINSVTGEFEERGGGDTPRELGLIDIHVHSSIDANVVLGNRRLAVIDLSVKAHQPQKNEDCSVWVVCNGEVYNYRELADQLIEAGHKFSSRSDVEVIIHGYEEWGIDLLLSKIVGMWGFAIWDQRAKKLYLARDRFGIKPLYYYFDNTQLIFASEIKAIRKMFPAKINEKRVAEFLWFLPYKSDETFFDGINQVMAAHYIIFDVARKTVEKRRYWRLSQINKAYGDVDINSSKEKFYDLFERSIKLHMRSDVPVGTCLSGGLDSSSIVCLAQKLLENGVFKERGLESVKKLKTFSSIPQEKRVSEAEYIEEAVFGSHVEPYFTIPTLQDFINDFDDLFQFHDEPFQDPSVYMQYRVMKLAREKGVKVLLDGQGGDECLVGYQRYIRDYLKDLVKERRYFKALIEFILTLDLTFPFFWRYVRKKFGVSRGAIGEVVKVKPPLNGASEHQVNSLAERLYYDLSTGSIIELLKYEDVNSMAFSIESRVPFLFHPLIEYLFKLPMTAKIRNGWTKYVLREAMKGVLPEKIRRRRSKLGFPAPDVEWAKKLVKDNIDFCLETANYARDYVNLKGFKSLCKRIAVKERIEDVQLFWRILILSKWIKNQVNKGLFDIA